VCNLASILLQGRVTHVVDFFFNSMTERRSHVLCGFKAMTGE
jgi:hypothetical protein